MFSKADTHIHTTYSDGLMSPEETIDYVATQTDLTVIAITDHDTAEGAFIAQAYAQQRYPHLDVIIGQEVTTDEGDVVGLFLESTLPEFKTAAEAIEAIHAQGGLAVAVHPFSRWSSFNKMKGVGSKIFDLPFDGVEVCNGFVTNFLSNPLSVWLNRHRGQNLPELGGSDSHVPFTVGQPGTRFLGRTAADFRQALELKQVRAEGLLWSVKSVFRLIPVLIKRGTPEQQRARSKFVAAKAPAGR